MNDANDAPTYLDAIHGLGDDGHRVRATFSATRFDRFYVLSLNYLSESHGSLGILGVPLNFLYNLTSAVTKNSTIITLAPVEIIAMTVA